MNWLDYFYYDEDSPTCLRWAVNTYNGKNNQIHKIKIGDRAGHVKNNGRGSQVQLDNKNYLCHRIIWEIFNGTIGDGLVIDHIDGNPQNNILSNLRVVSLKVNARNQKLPSNNTSRFVGVSFMTVENLDYWVSSWRDLTGKKLNKCFSVKKLGYVAAKLSAMNYREIMIEELNKQGAGYTTRHGS